MFPKALSPPSLLKTASTAEHKLQGTSPPPIFGGGVLLAYHPYIRDILHIMHIYAQRAEVKTHKTSLFNLPVLSIKPKSIYLSYL